MRHEDTESKRLKQQQARMYTDLSNPRQDEISARMKAVHDKYDVYCQACWMKLPECPGHPGEDLRQHGPFYMQLLKERTLLREAVGAGELGLAETLEALEDVFVRYHVRLTVDNTAGYTSATIEQEHYEVEEDWMITIPLQLYKDIVHTKLEGDTRTTQQKSVPWEYAYEDYNVSPELRDAVDRMAGLGENTAHMSNIPDPRAVFTPEQMEKSVKNMWKDTVLDENHPEFDPETVEDGRKDDDGKLRWDLLPPSLKHVVEVYTIGAQKYDDHNWYKGMGWHRVFRAMVGHAWKWWWGETYDQVDGQHHLASVAWGALTLMQYQDDDRGTDDRVMVDMGTPLKLMERPAGWDASEDFIGGHRSMRPPTKVDPIGLGNPPELWARAQDLAHGDGVTGGYYDESINRRG